MRIILILKYLQTFPIFLLNLIKYSLINQQMGSFRSTPDLQKHTVSKEASNLSFATSHMCGWRIYMEDAHIAKSPLTNKQHSLFAVFDGHGGAEVSTFVERHFITSLERNSNYLAGKYELALKQTFLEMDKLIESTAGKDEISKIQKQMRDKQNGPKYDQQSHAGCTANVILITPDSIYCANAGDSRSIASVNGQLRELSQDHKPQDKKQLDRITKAGGHVSFGRVNGGLNLSRALGDLEYKKGGNTPQQHMITCNPDITQIKNKNVDFILMGCDGIWQLKSNKQMFEWVEERIKKGIESGKIIEELFQQLVSKDSNSQYGMDNMSGILIKFKK